MKITVHYMHYSTVFFLSVFPTLFMITLTSWRHQAAGASQWAWLADALRFPPRCVNGAERRGRARVCVYAVDPCVCARARPRGSSQRCVSGVNPALEHPGPDCAEMHTRSRSSSLMSWWTHRWDRFCACCNGAVEVEVSATVARGECAPFFSSPVFPGETTKTDKSAFCSLVSCWFLHEEPWRRARMTALSVWRWGESRGQLLIPMWVH